MTPPPKRSKGKEILPETPVGYELPKFKVEPGEDFDWTPYVYHYDEDEEDRTGWDEINWNERISRFMREVRESRGYDVTVMVPRYFMSPFIPRPDFKKSKLLYPKVKRAADFAIAQLNADTVDKIYKLVDIVNVVITGNFMYLLTFTVEEAGAGGAAANAIITYQATVFAHPVASRPLKLKELRVKPPAAPQATS